MKKSNHLIHRLCFILILGSLFLGAYSSTEKQPLTVAESSGFRATSRYADVMAFIRELQRQTPWIKVESLCRSAEGKEVPLLILGNPVPSSLSEVKSSGKGVVYIQANIHAGEVEGKEASLMLARDILQQQNPPYLDRLVILIAPIFNADGNDKISPSNRRNQPGPEEGVGIRPNGQNLDLNRDAIKLESPELQGLLKNVLLNWDPLLLVDCHTTNGAYHEQTVTYSWPLNPNGSPALIEYQRSKMLPSINKILKEKYATLGLPYGGFRDYRDPDKGWETFGPQPRYITNYIGLRNRLAILDENYVHADYKTRVFSNYHFLLAILDYCYGHLDELNRLVGEADRKTVQRGLNPQENDIFAVEYELRALPDPVTILGFETEVIQREDSPFPQLKKTDRKKTYTVPYFADYVPKRTVPFPSGYLISPPASEIVQKLLQHGLTVERLAEAVTLEVESFKIKEIKSAERIFQGHRLNKVKGEYVREKKEFPEGTIFVSTAQPLAGLAAYLLEAESDDGLLVWNFFERNLVPQWGRGYETYSVHRLLKPVNLAKVTVKE